MCEDHDQARIKQHVIIHVSVVTRHHDNSLLPWYPLTDVAFIMAPIHLQRINVRDLSVKGLRRNTANDSKAREMPLGE